MAKRPRIAVVGSANVDLTTFSDQFPKPGETIFGQKFDLGFGGKGPIKPSPRGSAELMSSWWQESETTCLVPPASRTLKSWGSTLLTFARSRAFPAESRRSSSIPPDQNRIIVVKGANDELKPADVDAAADTLKSADCIVLQFEIPLETVYYTVEFARRNGIRCLLNPAPGGARSTLKRVRTRLLCPERTRGRSNFRHAGAQYRGRQELRDQTARPVVSGE